MKKLLVALLSISAVLSGVVIAQAELETLGGTGGLESLRGSSLLEETSIAEEMKKIPREQSLGTDYVYQPPLIPHSIRNYEVSKDANRCLACHNWKNAKDMGAPKISVTHYLSREDAVLADVSPRRYFCLQCHVPQTDAQPLVVNEFKRVESLR